MDGLLVHDIRCSAGIDVPEKFVGLLMTAAKRMLAMISKENEVRRTPRMSVDRLYIAHTRRIITTATTIRISCLKVHYPTTYNQLHQERGYMFIDS